MISTTEKEILNNWSPTPQGMQLGGELYNSNVYGIYRLSVLVDSDATGGAAIVIPFACEILDIIVECTAANADGTFTVKAGANAISDAIVCAVDKTMVRAGTIDDTYSTLAAAATVTAVANGAADEGKITLVVRRV